PPPPPQPAQRLGVPAERSRSQRVEVVDRGGPPVHTDAVPARRAGQDRDGRVLRGIPGRSSKGTPRGTPSSRSNPPPRAAPADPPPARLGRQHIHPHLAARPRDLAAPVRRV